MNGDARRADTMPALKPPILLIGNVRSGTSMMHDLFDLHPEVKAWYEPRTVWVYADPGRRHDRFDAGDATPRVKRYIRERFLRRQETHGGLRIMEKTPSNIMRIPYVHAIFPESKFVYIVREPLANLSSSEIKWRQPISFAHIMTRLRMTPRSQLHYYVGRALVDHFRRRILRRPHVSVWGVRYPGIYDDLARLTTEQVIAKQWAACSRQAEEDFASVDPQIVRRVRYEDFVADPVAQFEAILNHFDLDMTDGIAREVQRRVDPGRQLKWKRLDPEVIRACLPYLREEMARHGYTPPDDLIEEHDRAVRADASAAQPSRST